MLYAWARSAFGKGVQEAVDASGASAARCCCCVVGLPRIQLRTCNVRLITTRLVRNGAVVLEQNIDTQDHASCLVGRKGLDIAEWVFPKVCLSSRNKPDG